MSEAQEEATQGQVVYRRLLEEIRLGQLPPGSRLREVEIGERLGHSRTPVREALRLLEVDGLVVHQPRLGAVVRSLNYPEIMELYEMRAVLQGTAARLAARSASEAEIAELYDLNAEFAGAVGDQSRAAEINRLFHLTLQDSAKNRFLLAAINALQKTMMILGPTTLMEGERVRAAAEEHARVLEAIVARDGQKAELEMRSHIQSAQRSRLRILRSSESTTDEI
jgi:DNA-binding GntR family transcriptional regulator